MVRFRQFLFFFIFLMFFWLLLNNFRINQELIIGAVISLIIALLFTKTDITFSKRKFSFKAVLYACIFPCIFLSELIKANLDVAGRVVRPVIPINPGIVKVRTNLTSPLGRLILANSITLTPGTLTVDAEGEFLFIHWIDVSSGDIEETTRAITGKFERYLEVIFG